LIDDAPWQASVCWLLGLFVGTLINWLTSSLSLSHASRRIPSDMKRQVVWKWDSLVATIRPLSKLTVINYGQVACPVAKDYKMRQLAEERALMIRHLKIIKEHTLRSP